jgi:hypothetical protein
MGTEAGSYVISPARKKGTLRKVKLRKCLDPTTFCFGNNTQWFECAARSFFLFGSFTSLPLPSAELQLTVETREVVYMERPIEPK